METHSEEAVQKYNTLIYYISEVYSTDFQRLETIYLQGI